MIFGRRDFLCLAAAGVLRPAAPPKASACILVWQSGGCSHLDTFDMKPDAPAEYRSEFRPIRTNVSGIRICEHLPRTARQTDKLTILRSMTSRETNHERASSLLLGNLKLHAVPRRPFDLAAESPSLRDRYGRTRFGEDCLRARKAVQAGKRFLNVTQGDLRYDTHADNFRILKNDVLPEFDLGFAALIEDLHERRMLDSTLVLAMSEFGRTPRINPAAGRDHHCEAWSVCLAGAGLSGGRVLGATDRIGAEVTDLPVRPEDLVFNILTILGEVPDGYSAGGRIIPELFS